MNERYDPIKELKKRKPKQRLNPIVMQWLIYIPYLLGMLLVFRKTLTIDTILILSMIYSCFVVLVSYKIRGRE